jgi:hypothetical protein
VKTVKYQSRERKTNICQILTPFVFMALLTAFNILVNNIVGSNPIYRNEHPSIINPFYILPKPDNANLLNNNNSIILQPLYKNGTRIIYAMESGVQSNFSQILENMESPQISYKTRFLPFEPDVYISNDTFNSKSYYFPTKFYKFESKEKVDDEIYKGQLELPSIISGYYFKQINFSTNTFEWSLYFNHSLAYGEDVPFILNKITNLISTYLLKGNNII